MVSFSTFFGILNILFINVCALDLRLKMGEYAGVLSQRPGLRCLKIYMDHLTSIIDFRLQNGTS